MKNEFIQTLLKLGKADSIIRTELIQNLWSGYGEIQRVYLKNGLYPSVVLKWVNPPKIKNHSRGWNTDLGHQRKLKSYQVESYWYKNLAHKCSVQTRVPKCIHIENKGDEFFIILEDLNAAGYDRRLNQVSTEEWQACLRWLAQFHGQFLNHSTDGLWPIGSYWHLATRPEELEILTDQALKGAAPLIDKKLNSAKYKTLIHGDAKLANFCFDKKGIHTSAVDFQYLGGGVGVKDLAYFLGSCFSENQCEKNEALFLNYYFEHLEISVSKFHPEIDFNELKKEWHDLFYYAWADFHRFLKGWSPGHYKLNSYSERLCQKVLNLIQEGQK